MGKSQVVTIDGVGEVLFEQTARVKHLNISIKPFKPIRVAFPSGISFSQAQEIVSAKTEWIKKHSAKMKLAEASIEEARELPAIDSHVARKKLVGRLRSLQAQHGFTAGRIFIRNQKTRWGSCSAKNNISLNRKLAGLPDDLIDFIIIHELVHTRIKNHGPKFWAELLLLMPDAKEKSKTLNQYGVMLL